MDKPRASSRVFRAGGNVIRKLEMNKENRAVEHGSFSQSTGAARDCECDSVTIDRVRRRERIAIGPIDILHLTRELAAG